MILDANFKTLTGLSREMNQDSVFCEYTRNIGLFAVADGMGGHFRGEIASEIASIELYRWWKYNQVRFGMQTFHATVKALGKEITYINHIIADKYDDMGHVGGTTLCVLMIYYDAYAVFHIGDSRLYLSEKSRMKLLTVDDVWENLSRTEGFWGSRGFDDPRTGKLVKVLGTKREISASVLTGDVKKKMVFLLCTDGVHKYLIEGQLRGLLKKVKKAGDAAIVNEKIRKMVYRAGAPDNMSMVIVLVAKV